MTGRLEYVRRRLMLYREAEEAILSAQSYEVDGMRLTRADLSLVQDMIARLEHEELKLLHAVRGLTRSRLRVIIPMDGVHIRRPL